MLLARGLLHPAQFPGLVRVGSEFGGWWVPRSSMGPGVVVYCAGAGEDISFDLRMHDAGCIVRTFDPTPRALTHVSAVAPASDRFSFLPYGLWDEDTELDFYAPAVTGYVSHSAVNLHRTTDSFKAPVRSLRSLMHEFDDTRIDVLKMDIEGAELAVIDSLIREGPSPAVVCVEFDQPQPLRGIVRSAKRMMQAGYRLAKIERWNFTFLLVGE
jgi:FkbM family methyltransferase